MELNDYVFSMILQTITIVFSLYYKIGRLEERIKALEREVFNRGENKCRLKT